MVAVVVRDVQLPLAAAVSAVDPPHGLVELVDDDGDAAEARKGHDGIISPVGAEIT